MEQKFLILLELLFAVWIVWGLRLQISWIQADLECERLG